ncbi:Peptide methionine sulfoxide reductase [Lithohypha guttulata]|uniref:Peptide methionine sulfoxide reductase n=1 Tax=Lithohypha guttulata TaxID=1690604 RepID=UPI002DDFD358|nr:Peptide methionine sulfoxide reductase [Lithohypha guttulata]
MSRPLVPDSLAAKNFPEGSERAIVAGGCFWGLEELYRKDWEGKGMLDCRVGYTGGQTEAPDYRSQVTYKQLMEYFFKMHDPTTLNRQGADTGTQYRSAIFYVNDEQKKIAEEIKEKVGKEWYKGKPISTEIRAATKWYDAEDYHQDYLKKEPFGYHCPAHFVRKLPPLSS